MITFINVFTVRPEKQQDALRLIQSVYLEVVRHQPGYISARLLASDDGEKVIAIALWETEEHLQAMRQTQGFKDLHNQEFADAIVSSDGHVYTDFIEVPGTNHKHGQHSSVHSRMLDL